NLQPPAVVPEVAYDLEIVDGQLLRNGRKIEATLANAVDAARDRYPEANIVLSPGLGKIKIADLKLRAGLLADELEALRVASGGKFDVQGASGPNPPIDPNTGMPVAGARNLNTGLFVLHQATAQNERVVAAMNIGPYLEWLRHQPGETDKRSFDEEK